jgi:hypothetical protein
MVNKNSELTAAAVVLAVAVLCIFFPWLFLHKVFYWGDIGLFFLPLNHFLKDNLDRGVLPLWNPYLFCGAPFVGNPQVSLLYPSTLLLSLFPAAQAIMISEVAHIFAAGLFFWLFARRGSLKLSFAPAIFSSLTYMLCGYFVAKGQFPNMLAALTFVPLILYQTELLVKEPTVRRSFLFGVCLALQLLAAHTQITVFTIYLVVPYALFVHFGTSNRSPILRVFGMGLLGGVVGCALSCAYWLPVAQLIHSSSRQELTLNIANRFYLPQNELGNFVLPVLFGTPMRGNFHAHGNYWETDNYVGIVPFLFALFFIIRTVLKPKTILADLSQVQFWSVLFIVSVWLSLGTWGTLYRIAFDVLPALNAFHDPARLMLGANIAIALFAGAGMQLLTVKLLRRQVIALTCLVLVLSTVDLGYHDIGLYPVAPLSHVEGMADAPIPSQLSQRLSQAGAGRVLMPDSQRSWQSFTTYKSFEARDPLFLNEWPDTISPCLGMTYNIRETAGYDPEYRKDSEELVSFALQTIAPLAHYPDQPAPVIPENMSGYLGLLGVQYLVTYRVGDIKTPGLTPILHSVWERHKRRVIVYQNENYHSRGALYTAWTGAESQDFAIQAMQHRLYYAPGIDSFFSPAVEDLPSSANQKLTPPQAVAFTNDTPDYVTVSTPPVSRPSLVVLADTMHPGWTVLVDGKPARILRANGDQKAVFLPQEAMPMSHTVEFRYLPEDFAFGLYVSLATLSIIVGLLIGQSNRSKLHGIRVDT